MENNNKIVPKKLAGFWELMPNEQIIFSELLNKIEKIFRQNCFVPLDTPVLEYSEALLAKSGGETDKQVFRFTKGDTDMCMRYDLTVPLARFVSMHKEQLNFPFKRYQIGKVYRGERPQKGRFREFYQCDADIIGNGELSLVADAETIALFSKCFNAVGVDVEIRVSNREILSGYIDYLQKENLSSDILTILDKVDKVGINQAKEMLLELNLNEQESENLLKLSQNHGKIEDIMQNLRDFCDNTLFQSGLDHLLEISKYLKLMNVDNVIYDLSIIRGHDYYTGTVFEAFAKNEKSAIGGGGRFENLCSYFSDQKMPGVGMSIGVTRLFDLLMKQQISIKSEIDCAIITFDETFDDGLKIMTRLRENGVKADCFYENKSFKSKMKEANRRNVKYVLILGEDEIKTQSYALKDMETGEQEKLTFSQLLEKLRK
ncbi:MAG: histidine--tRNA ligase [Candidatus Caccovivens sp.]